MRETIGEKIGRGGSTARVTEPLMEDVVRVLVGSKLKPAPLEAKGAAPNCRLVGHQVADGGVRDFR